MTDPTPAPSAPEGETSNPAAPEQAFVAPAPISKEHSGKTGLLIGAIAIFIGSFLPWAELRGGFALSRTIYGTSGDGIFTILIALVIGAFAFVKPQNNILILVSIILSCVTGWISLSKMVSVASVATATITTSIGSGLILILIGAAITFFASFGISKPKK